MNNLILNILRIIFWISLIIWGLLTSIVCFFLLDRWSNPHTKSISNRDLQDYAIISIPLITVFILTRLIIRWMKKPKVK
jgi:heme/copper-type cytochrome/quinol oxidase subunit 2